MTLLTSAGHVYLGCALRCLIQLGWQLALPLEASVAAD